MCPRTTARRKKKESTTTNTTNSSSMSSSNTPAGISSPDMERGAVAAAAAGGGAAPAAAPVSPADPAHAQQYANWPLQNIRDPTHNDILYGRGGGTNHHPGNKRYRKWVEGRKVEYVNSKRLDKPVVALEIVKQWRAQSPPGRFLKMDDKTGLWNDVGDKKAREKTSQALREKAPQIRRELEEAATGGGGGGGEQRRSKKKTTFDVPKGGGVPKDRTSKDLNHLMLARDHSLGRDYLQPGESVDVGDFDWDEPVENLSAEDVNAATPPTATAAPAQAGPPGHRGGASTSGGSAGAGWGSGQFAYIEPPSSITTKSPHSPHRKHYSPPSRENSGYYPPPPPLPGGDVRVMSASSFPGPPPPPPAGAYPYPPSGSFPPPPPGPGAHREHSLAGYPLRNASVSSSARDSFAGSGSDADVEQRSRSYDEAYWQQGHASAQYGGPPPPGGYAYPPPSPYQGSPRHGHGGAPPTYPPYPQDYQPPPSYGYPDQQSAFDDRRASTSKSDIPQPPLPPEQQQRQWSGQSADYQRVADIIGQEGGDDETDGYKRSHSKNDNDKDGKPAKPKAGGLRRKISGGGVIPPPPDGAMDELKSTLPRPETVKRDTSHQCETEETKRRVQRSRLRRDHSLAGVALNGGDVSHEALSPREYEFSDPSSKVASEQSGASSDIAMRALSASMRQSSIGETKPASATKSAPKPPTLSADQRLTTVDAVRMAFEGDDDVLGGVADDFNKCNEDPNAKEAAPELMDGKPGSLTLSDRITTSDALSFAGIVDDKVLGAEKKPLPLADDLRLSTGGTVDNILASVEETVGDVVAGLSSDIDSISALGKPPSISTDGRLSTADSILAPPDADDLAAEFLTKDAALE